MADKTYAYEIRVLTPGAEEPESRGVFKTSKEANKVAASLCNSWGTFTNVRSIDVADFFGTQEDK
jgi:hypothetical protein